MPVWRSVISIDIVKESHVTVARGRGDHGRVQANTFAYVFGILRAQAEKLAVVVFSMGVVGVVIKKY